MMTQAPTPPIGFHSARGALKLEACTAQFVPGELSHKILREARAQQEEVDAEAAGLGPTDRRSVSIPRPVCSLRPC